jgi:CheY-like chemotaxis protein
MVANLLGEASDALAEAVDLEVALEAVAQLTVPALADFCAIDVLSSDRGVTRIAIPRVVSPLWTRTVDTWFPSNPDGQHPIANALRRGHPELASDATAAQEAVARRGAPTVPPPASYLVVPLLARGQTLGVLSLVSWTQAHRYRLEDLQFAARLARRLALAIDHRQLGAEIGEFLTVVSHELRTPLAAMLGWVTLLRRHVLSPAQVNRGLEVIERNTRLQARSLDDLLELTWLRAGSAALERHPVDMVAVVRDAVASVASEAADQGVALQVDGDLPAGRVPGDPLRLRQLVTAVLATAIADSHSGDSLGVLLTQRESSVCLAVVPAGSTLSLAGRPARVPRGRGGNRGFSLLLARRLAEMHGGRIEIDRGATAPGFGIRMTLPALEPGGAPAAETAPRPDCSDDGAGALAGRRVLLIEDDPDTREFLRLSLEERGVIVHVARSGAEGLAVLEREAVDLVLSDLTLPEGDGRSVLRAIRARGMAGLPAVALSALSGPAERAGSAAAGFAEHLAKPVDPEHLARCLGRVISRSAGA